jgi:parallel beta-helix repeat protein
MNWIKILFLGERKMKKALIFVIIFLFVSAGLVSVVGSSSVTKEDFKQKSLLTTNGNILYVGGSGPGNYSKIQDAVDNATDGDTVFVYDDSSPYSENVTVDKSITIQGENMTTTIIDDGGFTFGSDFVKITSFTIQNGDTGVLIENFSDNIIENCVFINLGAGVQLYDTINNSIRNCSFVNNGLFGVQMQGFHMDNNEVSYCDFVQNLGLDIPYYPTGALVIESYRSQGIKINHCNFSNNHKAIILYLARFIQIIDNNIANNLDNEGVEIIGFSFCDLRNNWWGSPQGPKITLNRPFNENPLIIRNIEGSDTVIFNGWRAFFTGIIHLCLWRVQPVPDTGSSN